MKLQLKMKQLIYKLKGQKLLQAAAVVLLLTSACSNKKQTPRLYNYNNTSSDSWYAAGILPTAFQSNFAAIPINSNSNQEIQVQSTPAMVQQTSQDFGDLNWCYQTILSRGNQLFGTGASAETVFEGAGNAIVKCYNDVLTERARLLEEAKVAQEWEKNKNQFFAQMLPMFISRNNSQFEIGLPPSRFK